MSCYIYAQRGVMEKQLTGAVCAQRDCTWDFLCPLSSTFPQFKGIFLCHLWKKSSLYNRSRYHKWDSQSSHQTPTGCLSITFYVQSCTEWGSDITFSAEVMLPNHKLDCITKVIWITLDVKIALICTRAAPTARTTHTHTHTHTSPSFLI